MIYGVLQGQRHGRIRLGPQRVLKVELTNDNIHSFNTRWDETMIAMKKTDEEILDNFIVVRFNSQNS